MKISAQLRATLIGFIAVVLWGMLAVLVSYNRSIPTLQLTAMTFFIAFAAGAVMFIKNGCNFSVLKQPPAVWLSGIIGLFGYHFLYFSALRNAPPIEASLINYLWPILIVFFSAFLPGERLQKQHILGVILGFTGVAVLILQGGAFRFKAEYTLGYVLAVLGAVTWALYSVNLRRFSAVPIMMIGAYCGITALLSFICHLALETTVMPNKVEWLAILLLGIGPMGCAFFVWDYGMKLGNIKLLGALSYMAPLLSSLLLIVFGQAEPTLNLLFACLLIVTGAVVAARGNLGLTKK